MAFQVIPVTADLWVEGHSDADGVGDFKGRALGIGVRDTDPVSAVVPEAEAPGHQEGLAGWGTTYLLVACPDKERPVWVSKQEVRRHWLGEDGASG